MEIKFEEKKLEVKKGITFNDLLEQIKKENVVAIKENGKLRDLQEKISHSGDFSSVSLNSEKGKEVLNHSAAHILAFAVKSLYPQANPTIGPVTRDLPGPREIGFYYDFYREEPFNSEDLKKIEEKMRELLDVGVSFERRKTSKENAMERYRNKNRFKVELIEELGDTVVLYKHTANNKEFVDLCEGPHLQDSSPINAFTLLGTSSAYWKGDAQNPAVQRIYGIAFQDEKGLSEYLELKKKAEERDHVKLGKKLDLFRLYGDIAPGFPIYTPKGKIILQELKNWMREFNEKLGYKEVETPHIYKAKMWKQSGHYEAYKDKMFIVGEGEKEYAVKPMNCPGHLHLYKRKPRSYRELPVRFSEFAKVYRWEQSGELHGLTRVRSPIQDDGHILCKKDQIKEEVRNLLSVMDEIFQTLGIENTEIRLATKPEKHIGSEELWDLATSTLKKSLNELNKEFRIEEGEGAFYGPKIDIHIQDALGRWWQCTTIQLDFFTAERFGLTYTDENGEKKTPILIHRTIFGSLDRFLGILIEHWNGKFPVWLSPIQVRIIPITDRNQKYAEDIAKKLKEANIRVKKDYRRESLGYKIRDAQVQRIPYMLIVGDKEEQENTVSVRKRTEEEEHGVKLEDFINRVSSLIDSQSLEL